MITLPTNISDNYLKTGNDPRFIVWLPNAGASGLEFRQEFRDSGTISRTAKPSGGLEQVSSITVRNLELENELDFTSSVTKSPLDEGAIRGAGRCISQGTATQPYADVRNSTTGTFATAAVTVGQKYAAGSDVYYTYRAFLQFDIPALTSCDEFTIWLTGLSDNSTTDFDVVAVIGTWSALTDDSGIYNDFTGWAASGAYTVTELNDTVNSSEYVTYDASEPENESHFLIRFNRDGLDEVVSASGGTLRIMLLSRKDINNTAPTGDEFMQFVASSAEARIRYNTYELTNQEAHLYMYYSPEPASYSLMLERYSGIVDSFKISNNQLDMSIKKSDLLLNTMLPSRVIDEVNWPLAPEENIGKPYPILYGDFALSGNHQAGVANFSGLDPLAGAFGYTYPDCFKVIMIKYDGEDKTYLTAGNQLKADGKPFFAFNSSTRLFEVYPVISGILAYVTETKRNFALPTSTSNMPDILSEKKYKSIPAIMPYKYETIGSPTNPEYAYDKDTDTYAVLNDSTDKIYFYFATPPGISGDGAVAFTLWAQFENGADPTALTMTIERDEKAVVGGAGTWNAFDTYTPWTGDSQETYAFYSLSGDGDRVATRLEQYRIILWRDSDSTGEVKITDLFASAAYTAESMPVLYSIGQGQPDDGSGTITGVASKLIENPAHVLHSIAVNEVGIDSARIDTTGMTLAASSLTDWTMAFQVLDRLGSNDLFDRIGRESRSSVEWDEQNKLTVMNWDSSASFPHSGTDIPGNLDIFQRDPNITVSSGSEIMARNIIIGDVSFSPVPDREIYNSFELHFRKNYASGDYMEVLTIDNGAGTAGSVSTNLIAGDEASLENSQTISNLKSICANSYTKRGSTTNQLVFSADYIRSRATAVKLFQHLIEFYAPRRMKASFTSRENALWLENGDIINIRHFRINEYFGTATADRKKWWVYETDHDTKTGDIDITAIDATSANRLLGVT